VRGIARGVLRSLQCREPEISLLEGKYIWEILPGRRVDKWSAVQFILRRERRRPEPAPFICYVGDDVSDECVFRKLRGISVAVGKRRHTAARYYVRSSAEVGRLIERWSEALK